MSRKAGQKEHRKNRRKENREKPEKEPWGRAASRLSLVVSRSGGARGQAKCFLMMMSTFLPFTPTTTSSARLAMMDFSNSSHASALSWTFWR